MLWFVSAAEALALAAEITKLRQRGFLQLDLQTSQQNRLPLPILERLAARHLGAAAPRSRSLLLQLYLDVALRAFAAAGCAPEAAFIRPLFFDPRPNPIGSPSPGKLLQDAREKSELSEEAFRELQRAHFRQFAEFLLTLRPASGNDSNEAIAEKTLRRYAAAVSRSTRQQPGNSTWVGVETPSGVIEIAPVSSDVSTNDLKALLTHLG
jgi:hypothetical protein